MQYIKASYLEIHWRISGMQRAPKTKRTELDEIEEHFRELCEGVEIYKSQDWSYHD